MEMILLDWTRMGKSYCLAGVVEEQGRFCVVRPLLAKHRDAPVRNAGWSAYLLDGHQRWEVFELLGAEPAAPQPPHLEDLWVRALRSHRRLASPEQRQAILATTTAGPGQLVFGVSLTRTNSAAYLPPDLGQRSLATIVVPSNHITFSASRRDGTAAPDYRAALNMPGLDGRWLPVKDHHLLCRAERAASDLTGQVKELTVAVQQMGDQAAVRLGLSRPFQSGPGAPPACWLMADGFFSLTDPQP